MNIKKLVRTLLLLTITISYSQTKLSQQNFKKYKTKLVEIEKMKSKLENHLLKSQKDSIKNHIDLLYTDEKSESLIKFKIKISEHKRLILRNKISELNSLEKEFKSMLAVIKN